MKRLKEEISKQLHILAKNIRSRTLRSVFDLSRKTKTFSGRVVNLGQAKADKISPQRIWPSKQ